MAEAIDFPEANGELVAPAGQEDLVRALAVLARGPSPEEPSGSVTSCWRLGDDELAEVLRTGVVWMSAWGNNHSPLYITGRRGEVVPGAQGATPA